MKDGKHESGLAVHVRGQKRQRRRMAHHDPHAELVRRALDEVAVLPQDLFCLAHREHDQARRHFRADRVQSELELGHDAEIAAAAAQRPEEVRVLRLRSRAEFRRQRSRLRREQIVDGHSVLARQPAEAAAEREAGDSRRRVDAHSGVANPCACGRVVEVGERGAGLHIGARR